MTERAATRDEIAPVPAPLGGERAWWSRYAFALWVVGLNLALLTAARITLHFLYHDDFAEFAAGDLGGMYLRGLRFDLSVTLAANGLPLLMMTLPFRFSVRRAWQLVWGWSCYVLFMAISLLTVADVVYFDFVHRHIGPEITTVGEEAGDLWALALGEHAVSLGALVLVAVLCFLLWRRLLRTPPPPVRHRNPWRTAAAVVVPLVLIVSGARGSPLGRPLTPPDAFESDGPTGAQLVLNGPASIFHSLFQRTRRVTEYYPRAEALQSVRDMIVAPNETLTHPDKYPLHRRAAPRTAPGERPPNVVIILLEGWSLMAVDRYRERLGKEALGATPNFDALSREGLLLSRLYASGQRTRNGYAAVLAGVPTIPRTPYFGRGLEQSNLTYLGWLAREAGYETHFVMGVGRTKQSREQNLRLAGFEFIAGEEDMPPEGRLELEPGKKRVLDEFTLAEAHERFSRAREPFLGVVHTDSTHEPYVVSRNREYKRFGAKSRTERYRTAVACADWALGQFFEQARRADYFDRTVFLLVSDHIQRKPPGKQEPPALFHIPGAIFGPGIEPGVHERVASQTDVIATVSDLAGWGATHATFGRSLLDATAGSKRGVLCGIPDLLVWVEDDAWIAHNGSVRIESGKWSETADLDAAERRMLSYVQMAGLLLLEDRVAPRAAPDHEEPR